MIVAGAILLGLVLACAAVVIIVFSLMKKQREGSK
jgi:hypothetical protein